MYISSKVKLSNVYIALCLLTLNACGGGGSNSNDDDETDQVACDTLCPQDTTLTLNWTANASIEVVEGYRIYFVEGSTEILLSNIGVNDQGFSASAPSINYLIEDDLRLLAGDQACFKIIAYNTLGDSPSSDQVCATIN